MARWQVEITGHLFDVEELSGWFTDPNFRVAEDGGTFFLEAAELETQAGSADVHAAAQLLVKRMNGIAKLRSSSFRNVDLGAGVRELGEQGEQRRHVVLAVGTAEARAKVNAVLVKVGDAEAEPPSPGSQQTDAWMRAASADPDAREAVDLWSGTHDWSRLYKVYEIVHARADIIKAGWASRAQLTLFKRTANHQDAAGGRQGTHVHDRTLLHHRCAYTRRRHCSNGSYPRGSTPWADLSSRNSWSWPHARSSLVLRSSWLG